MPRRNHASSVDTDRRPSPPAAPAPRQPPTILLIDDDPGICDALSRVLIMEGWRVVTATSGEQALERLQTLEPDLMITDLCMARINGWDILFHEKLQHPQLPILVITALPPQATHGADEFATQFFQKPLDLDVMIAAIHRHLDPPPSP